MKPILVHHQQGSTMCPGGLGWLVHSVALWDPWGLGQAALEDGSLDGRGWFPWRRKESGVCETWLHSPDIAPEAPWSSCIVFPSKRRKGR